ncbi:hypothetical protein JNW90_10545 [Micromonospora sp. STR1s_5]|nr:hypothetical protein [Micromonospora sp. STR1s_5]
MAQTSFPLPPDRIITDNEFERLNSACSTDGWRASFGDTPIFYADNTGMQIKVRPAKSVLLQGFMWESGPTEFTKAIAPNTSGLTRVDLVVIRLTRPGFGLTIEIRPGTPGAGAPGPFLDYGNPGWLELPIGFVTVPHNDTSIDASQAVSTAYLVDGDGSIRCYSQYRPPLVAGRTIWEVDTGRQFVCTGNRWLLTAEETTPTQLPFATASGVPQWGGTNFLHRRNGRASLMISPQRLGGNIAANATVLVGTLPPAYRPLFGMFEVPIYATSSGPGRLLMHADGRVEGIFYGGLAKERYFNAPPIDYPHVY